jgi:hypothetical protein
VTQEVPFSLSLPLFLALSFPLSKSRRRQCEPLSSHHARVGHATKAPPQPCLSFVTRTFNPIPYANEGVGRLIYALTDPRLLPPSFPLPRPTVCLPSPHYRRSLTTMHPLFAPSPIRGQPISPLSPFFVTVPLLCLLPPPRPRMFAASRAFTWISAQISPPPSHQLLTLGQGLRDKEGHTTSGSVRPPSPLLPLSAPFPDVA